MRPSAKQPMELVIVFCATAGGPSHDDADKRLYLLWVPADAGVGVAVSFNLTQHYIAWQSEHTSQQHAKSNQMRSRAVVVSGFKASPHATLLLLPLLRAASAGGRRLQVLDHVGTLQLIPAAMDSSSQYKPVQWPGW